MKSRDPRYVHLHNPHEFDKRFEEMTGDYDTYEEAYQAVEAEYKKTFGGTKYSNYESYRKVRAKRIKKKKANTKKQANR